MIDPDLEFEDGLLPEESELSDLPDDLGSDYGELDQPPDFDG
jgi:hypothetical protein